MKVMKNEKKLKSDLVSPPVIVVQTVEVEKVNPNPGRIVVGRERINNLNSNARSDWVIIYLYTERMKQNTCLPCLAKRERS